MGVGIGIATMLALGRREGVDPDVLWELAIVLLVGIVGGSRLEYVRTHWGDFADEPLRVLALRDGGLVFYGGLVGVLLATAAWVAWRRAPVWKLLDLMAIGLPFGHAVGRVGCLLAGCCYGAPTGLPWGVTYPAGGDAPAGVPVHPTQLYEAAFDVALGAALAWARPRRRFDGQLFCTFLFFYPTFRALNETMRGDAIRGFVAGGLSNAQVTSLVLFALGATVWWARRATADRTGTAR